MADKVQSIMALVGAYCRLVISIRHTGEEPARKALEALESAIREAIAAPGVAQDEGNERFDATVDSVRDWLRTEQGVYLSLPSTRKLVLLALAAAPSPTAEQRPPYCGSGHCSCIECPYVSIKGGPAE